MTDRERLLEILNVPIYPHENVDPVEAVADYLLDNGVTFHKWVPTALEFSQRNTKNIYAMSNPLLFLGVSIKRFCITINTDSMRTAFTSNKSPTGCRYRNRLKKGKTMKEIKKIYCGVSVKKCDECSRVEVVRCGKCKHWDPDSGYCQFWHGVRHPGHYCGEGERKIDG